MSSVSLLAGAVQRTWDVCVNARHYQIVLEHHTVSGTRSLSIDSVEVRGSEGTNTPFSKKGCVCGAGLRVHVQVPGGARVPAVWRGGGVAL